MAKKGGKRHTAEQAIRPCHSHHCHAAFSASSARRRFASLELIKPYLPAVSETRANTLPGLVLILAATETFRFPSAAPLMSRLE